MAGRIPQAFLDNLLDRLDIVEVVDRRVKLKKTGKNYSARCPFHEEKTPSFSVNPEKQFYYCFGCGAGGNALSFVMDYENVDFPQAVESLASSAGLEVPREPSRGGPGQDQRDQGNKPLYNLMEQVASFYQQQLRSHPEAKRAIAYLKERGLTGQIAKKFDLGFAPPGWHNLQEALAATDEQQALLMKSGMLVENDKGNIYDRFRDRVVYPIRDQRGRVIAFGGRVLGDDKPKYLNSPETEIFQKGRELYGLYEAKKANRKLDQVLVVEGYMDVIALAQHDINNATATLGTATSKTHLERLYRLCSEVVFCFDGDEAGRKAAVRALEAALPCMEDGHRARFLFLPEGEDPDTAVRNGGNEHFQQLIQGAMPLETFLFESAADGLDISNLDGRARLSKLALPYIRQMPDGVFKQLMFQSLAERTGLELSSLMRLETPVAPPSPASQIDSQYSPDGHGSASGNEAPPQDWDYPPADYQDYPSTGSDHGTQPDSAPRQRTVQSAARAGHTNLAQSALALILHQPEVARQIDPQTLIDLTGEDVELLRELLELVHRRPESNTGMLLGHWYGTPEGDLLNRLAGQERLIPTAGIEQQFMDTMENLVERRPRDSKLAAQVDKLRLTNYAQVSELEKQRLRELLQEKQQRDAARNKPKR